MNAGAEAVVGRPVVEAWDGLAAAPQLLLIEAFTAEAHVIATGRAKSTTFLFVGAGVERGVPEEYLARGVRRCRTRSRARQLAPPRNDLGHSDNSNQRARRHPQAARQPRGAECSDRQRAAHASRYNDACCRQPRVWMQLWGARVIVWDVLRPPHNCFLWKRLQQKLTLCRGARDRG